MILVIRISGLVDVPRTLQEGLFRIRLKRKYSATLLRPTPENLKLLRHLRNHVAFGEIDEDTLSALVEKRAELKNKSKKLSLANIINQIEKKDMKSWEIKPFFRLHPPRGGIDSKKHFGTSKKSVLGDNKKEINNLVRRML